MRTKAILLVRDTVFTLSHRPADGKYRSVSCPFPPYRSLNRIPWFLGTQEGIWRQSCDQLVALLYHYAQSLLSNLRRFEELGDEGGAELIRGCCIVCFAHIAVLCEALSKLEPAPQTGVDTLCDSSLERLGELSGVTCTEEYTHHDRLLGVRSTQQRQGQNR